MKIFVLPLLTLLATTPLHAAIIANWNLDETSGNLIDATGGNPEGVHIGTGGTPAYASPGVPAGTYGSIQVTNPGGFSLGLRPSTEDDYFVLGADNNNPVMNIDRTGSFTVMGWVNPQSPTLSSTYRFLSTGSGLGADRGWGIGLRLPAIGTTTASLRFTNYGVADNDSSTFTITHGAWLHLAVTYNNGAISYFLNGDSLDTDTSLFGNDGVAARLVIGGRVGGNDVDQMNGLVDGIRVYDSVLSIAEIRDAAVASVSVPEPSSLAVLLGLTAFSVSRRRRA